MNSREVSPSGKKEVGGVDISEGNAGVRPSGSRAAPPAYLTYDLWDRGSEGQRIAWLSAAGIHARFAVIFCGKNWSQLSSPVRLKLHGLRVS